MSNQAGPDLAKRSRAQDHAFTLLELLVASALMLMLLALLLSVVSNTTLLASKTTEQIEATRIARESLDLIGRDLAAAALPWSRTNTNSLQFLVNPDTVTGRFANKDSAFWQAPLIRSSTQNSNGDLAIVGYFVLKDFTVGSQNSRLQLRRVFVEPGATNYSIYSSSSWVNSSLLTEFAPATAADDATNAQRGWVSDGILGMWIQCLDKTGNILSGAFDSKRAKFGTTNWTTDYPANYPYTRLPAFVEVTLVCVAPKEIFKIQSLPDTTAFSATNVSAFVQQFRTNNPGVRSVSSFSRKFNLRNSD